MYKTQTSSDGECSKLVLSNGKSGIVVSCDPQVVPLCWVQIQHHKVSSWFDIIGHLVPFCLWPLKTNYHLFIAIYNFLIGRVLFRLIKKLYLYPQKSTNVTNSSHSWLDTNSFLITIFYLKDFYDSSGPAYKMLLQGQSRLFPNRVTKKTTVQALERKWFSCNKELKKKFICLLPSTLTDIDRWISGSHFHPFFTLNSNLDNALTRTELASDLFLIHLYIDFILITNKIQ